MESQELKRLVEKYSIQQLEACIAEQVEKGANACQVSAGGDDVVNELSKAEVVRELMDQGRSFPEALRELGRRIREVYGKES